jgi:hypothetical protein
MPIGGLEGKPSLAGGAGRPVGARNLDAGTLLIGLGAIILLVSLFLEWYQPNAEAWDVFEVWDLVLAALAVAALVAVAGRLGFGTPRPASWLIGASLAALVIVIYALVDPPPIVDAAGGAGNGFGDPGTGLWLALAATILMTAGVLLSVARISVAFSTGGPAAGEPLARRRAAAADPLAPDPVVGGAGPAAGEPAGGLGTRGSRRFERATPSADPDPLEPGIPPTEPTRRI